MKRTVTVALAAALTLSACAAQTTTSGSSVVPTSTTSTTTVDPPTAPAFRALVEFDACDDLLEWTIDHALERVGPYGLDGYGGYLPYDVLEDFAPQPAIAGERSGAAQQKDAVIGTNLQEAGVDEPDLVKTDGERIVVVSGNRLSVLTIDGSRLSLDATIDLGFWTESLFLDGDRVIAVADGGFDVMPLLDSGVASDRVGPESYSPTVTVAEIDISDPSDPEMTGTLQIDGRVVSSRMVDGAVRLVVSSGPTGFAWSYPEGGGLRSERVAEEENRAILERSTVQNWLPYFVLTDLRGRDEVVEEGTLLACDRTHRPDEFSGFTTLSLVTLSPDELSVVDATAVFADGDVVYSSDDAAYVATTRWVDPLTMEDRGAPVDMQTRIHKFDLTADGADYSASGVVPGYLLSQWSMSEYDGYLRVASTDAPEWWDGPRSESMVTVLSTTGGTLRAVGTVDGLGRGERIYAVRFFDDLGYVVTFRQTDPLYVIDLSDPEKPTVSGELKIPGYSAYLHPVGTGFLLGVGRDADLDGRTSGLQASLFDVTDPTDPARVDRFTMDGGWSEVEWDHHAFLHDPESGLTIIPFERWDDRKEGPPPNGGLVLRVTEDGIREVGVISHERRGYDRWAPIRRSIVIGDVIVTVSEGGLMASDAGSLETLDWVDLG